MKYIVYLFYRYYNQGATMAIPYYCAVFAMLMLLFINIFSLMILLVPDMTKILFTNNTRIELLIYSSISGVIGYLLLSKLIPKKEILEITNIPKNVKLHGWILFLYIIVSFIFLMFLFIKQR